MSDVGRLFLEACGASGPVSLAWDEGPSGAAGHREFETAAILVGGSAGADLAFDHRLISKRHAYLQMIEGRLYAIDLESREGLRWSGVPRRAGWVDGARPVQVGPVTIRVMGSAGETPGASPGPHSRRFVSRDGLPAVVLEVRDDNGKPRRWGMDRALALVGSSPDCKVRLQEPGASRYACSLVRTPKGVWMVDLLSTRGVKINGIPCRLARLEDGDVIQIGKQTMRVTYEEMPIISPRPPAVVHVPPEAWELVPEMVLGQLQNRTPAIAETSSASFDHALKMLVQLLGEIHRDHLEVVREEMEQIRRLNQEISTLRQSTQIPKKGIEQIAAEPSKPEPRDRPAPQAIHAIVGDRLAAWDKERQSRWRRVMDLLVKP